MTMAWDTTPLILAGFRLQSRTAMRFCICTGTERRAFTALRKTELSHRVLVYLVQRYVLDQSTDHSPGRGLPHIHLLHVQAVGVWVLLGFDYSSHAQIQSRHVHLGIILAWGGLFLLCFISSLHRRKERQPGFGCVKSIFDIFKENWKWRRKEDGNNIGHLSEIRLNFPVNETKVMGSCMQEQMTHRFKKKQKNSN